MWTGKEGRWNEREREGEERSLRGERPHYFWPRSEGEGESKSEKEWREGERGRER